MKIAIAAHDGDRVATHTGRCRGFSIFEITEKTAVRLEFRENTFTAHAHGACHGEDGPQHSHTPLVEAIADCCVLVTRGLGPRLVHDLASVGVDAYVCDTERVDDAATQFARGELRRLEGVGCSHHS